MSKDENNFSFKNFDFIGDQPNFLVNKSTRFQTNLGALFTIVISIGALILGINEFIIMINRSNPIVSVSNEFQSNFTYNATGQMPLFMAIHKYGNRPIPEQDKYLTLNVYNNYIYPNDPITGKSKTFIKVLKTFPCKDKETMAMKYGKEFSNLYEKNGDERINRAICLDYNDTLEFNGVIGEVPASFLSIGVEKCQNMTASNIVCKPMEEINSMLKDDFVVYFSLGDTYFDNSKPQASIRTLFNNIFAFNPTIYQSNYLELQVVDYKTDNGILYSEIKTDISM
jgi:hypothetical protein